MASVESILISFFEQENLDEKITQGMDFYLQLWIPKIEIDAIAAGRRLFSAQADKEICP